MSIKIPLTDVLISANTGPVSISTATLLITKESISDNLGGHLPGMTRWMIIAGQDLPHSLLTGSVMTFRSGRYAGSCIMTDPRTLKGTGLIEGV